MKFNTLHTVVIVFLLLSTAILAQEDEKTPQVQLISRVQNDQILLRWAVDEAVAWQKTNSNGYILEKYLFSRDGNRLSQPEKLWAKTIKADPLETWQDIVMSNDYAAIIAQALYGESFAVEGEEGELASIVNMVQELEQRFSMALLAADMNFEAAVKAGWGYTDTEVQPNEVYVYRIKSALPQEQLAVKSSSTLAGLKDYEPLPAPIDLQGIFGDKNVVLTWEYALFKSIYTSYNLERSEDGKTFTPLNKEPLVNLNDKPNAPAKRMYYIDSLAQNDKTYYYRVRGISPFGEPGLYSDTISGQGQPALSYTPRIYDYKFTERANEVRIIWEFPKEGEEIIDKFQLNRAEEDSGPFTVVVDSIPVSKRELLFSDLEPANYFTITAVGKTPNQKKTSFSTLIQRDDSTPPAIPVNLLGEIDSLGVVRLNWKMNHEKDFLGYRVFRGFTKTEEPSQLTVSPISDSLFIDTVTIKNLNSKVYYQVVSVDKRFNTSEKSEVLILEKPDVIPPTAPVFSDYKIEQGEVKLTWIPSSEKDATHILSRKNMTDDSAWEAIYTVTDTIQSYTDTDVEADKKYRYSIKAVDKSGLESLASTPITIEVIDLSLPDLIKEINYNLSREENYIELFWRADDDNIVEYTLYKQVNDTDPSTWRILPSNIRRVIDEALYPNQTYTYYLRATLTTGRYSQLKKVVINY